MGCKYPENSRSYKSCALCSDKNICEESTNINNATTLLSASEAHRKTVDNIKNCSTKEYIQRRGRVLRKFDGKDYAEIYDFITLPRELESVQNYTKEELQGDSALVKNELRRIKEFSQISMNEMESLSLIDEIQTAYQISDKDLFENN